MASKPVDDAKASSKDSATTNPLSYEAVAQSNKTAIGKLLETPKFDVSGLNFDKPTERPQSKSNSDDFFSDLTEQGFEQDAQQRERYEQIPNFNLGNIDANKMLSEGNEDYRYDGRIVTLGKSAWNNLAVHPFESGTKFFIRQLAEGAYPGKDAYYRLTDDDRNLYNSFVEYGNKGITPENASQKLNPQQLSEYMEVVRGLNQTPDSIVKAFQDKGETVFKKDGVYYYRTPSTVRRQKDSSEYDTELKSDTPLTKLPSILDVITDTFDSINLMRKTSSAFDSVKFNTNPYYRDQLSKAFKEIREDGRAVEVATDFNKNLAALDRISNGNPRNEDPVATISNVSGSLAESFMHWGSVGAKSAWAIASNPTAMLENITGATVYALPGIGYAMQGLDTVNDYFDVQDNALYSYALANGGKLPTKKQADQTKNAALGVGILNAASFGIGAKLAKGVSVKSVEAFQQGLQKKSIDEALQLLKKSKSLDKFNTYSGIGLMGGTIAGSKYFEAKAYGEEISNEEHLQNFLEASALGYGLHRGGALFNKGAKLQKKVYKEVKKAAKDPNNVDPFGKVTNPFVGSESLKADKQGSAYSPSETSADKQSNIVRVTDLLSRSDKSDSGIREAINESGVQDHETLLESVGVEIEKAVNKEDHAYASNLAKTANDVIHDLSNKLNDVNRELNEAFASGDDAKASQLMKEQTVYADKLVKASIAFNKSSDKLKLTEQQESKIIDFVNGSAKSIPTKLVRQAEASFKWSPASLSTKVLESMAKTDVVSPELQPMIQAELRLRSKEYADTTAGLSPFDVTVLAGHRDSVMSGNEGAMTSLEQLVKEKSDFHKRASDAFDKVKGTDKSEYVDGIKIDGKESGSSIVDKAKQATSAYSKLHTELSNALKESAKIRDDMAKQKEKSEAEKAKNKDPNAKKTRAERKAEKLEAKRIQTEQKRQEARDKAQKREAEHQKTVRDDVVNKFSNDIETAYTRTMLKDVYKLTDAEVAKVLQNRAIRSDKIDAFKNKYKINRRRMSNEAVATAIKKSFQAGDLNAGEANKLLLQRHAMAQAKKEINRRKQVNPIINELINRKKPISDDEFVDLIKKEKLTQRDIAKINKQRDMRHNEEYIKEGINSYEDVPSTKELIGKGYSIAESVSIREGVQQKVDERKNAEPVNIKREFGSTDQTSQQKESKQTKEPVKEPVKEPSDKPPVDPHEPISEDAMIDPEADSTLNRSTADDAYLHDISSEIPFNAEAPVTSLSKEELARLTPEQLDAIESAQKSSEESQKILKQERERRRIQAEEDAAYEQKAKLEEAEKNKQSEKDREKNKQGNQDKESSKQGKQDKKAKQDKQGKSSETKDKESNKTTGKDKSSSEKSNKPKTALDHAKELKQRIVDAVKGLPLSKQSLVNHAQKVALNNKLLKRVFGKNQEQANAEYIPNSLDHIADELSRLISVIESQPNLKDNLDTQDKYAKALVDQYSPFLTDSLISSLKAPELFKELIYDKLVSVEEKLLDPSVRNQLVELAVNPNLSTEMLNQLNIPSNLQGVVNYYNSMFKAAKEITNHLKDLNDNDPLKHTLHHDLMNSLITLMPPVMESLNNSNHFSDSILKNEYGLSDSDIQTLHARTTPKELADKMQDIAVSDAVKLTEKDQVFEGMNSSNIARVMELRTNAFDIESALADRDMAKVEQLLQKYLQFEHINYDHLEQLGVPKEMLESLKEQAKERNLDDFIDNTDLLRYTPEDVEQLGLFYETARQRQREEDPDYIHVGNGFALPQGSYASLILKSTVANQKPSPEQRNYLRSYFLQGNSDNFFTHLSSEPLEILKNPDTLTPLMHRLYPSVNNREMGRIMHTADFFSNVFVNNFTGALNKTLGESVKAQLRDGSVNNATNYVNSLVNSNGKIDSATATIFSALAFDWLISSSNAASKPTFDNFEHLLGDSGGVLYPKKFSDLMDGHTIDQQDLVHYLGSIGVQTMNLAPKKSAPSNAKSLLEQAIGQVIFDGLVHQGLLVPKEFNISDIENAIGRNTAKLEQLKTSGDTTMNVVKLQADNPIYQMLYSKRKNSTELEERDRRVNSQFIQKLLNIDEKLHIIETPEVSNVIKKRSTFGVSVGTHHIANKDNRRPYNLKHGAASLYYKLNPKHQELIFGFDRDSVKRQNFGTEISSENGKTENGSRQQYVLGKTLNHFDDLVAKAALEGVDRSPDKIGYYFTNVFWRNGRIGNLSLMDGQANKQIRAFQGYADWKYDFETGDIRQVDPMSDSKDSKAIRFLKLAVASNAFGLDADKMTDADVLHEFRERIDAPVIQEALMHLRELAKDPTGEVSEVASSAIANAVADAGQNAMSFTALYHYAEFLNAMDGHNGGKFQMNIARSVDGITNGAFITSLQSLSETMGIDQRQEYMRRFGALYGDDVSYAHWRKHNNDAYTRLGIKWRDYQTNHVESLDPAVMQKLENLLGPIGIDTKQSRDLAKYPLLQTFYSAGLNSIMRGISEQAIDNLHTELNNIINDGGPLSPQKEKNRADHEVVYNQVVDRLNDFMDLVGGDKYLHFNEAEKHFTGQQKTDKKVVFNQLAHLVQQGKDGTTVRKVREVDITQHIGDLNLLVDQYYREPLQKALHEEYGPVFKYRDLLNNINNALVHSYNAMYQAEYNKQLSYLQKKRPEATTITVAQEKAIMKKLNRYLPSVVSAESIYQGNLMKDRMFKMIDEQTQNDIKRRNRKGLVNSQIKKDRNNSKIPLNKITSSRDANNENSKVVTRLAQPIKLPDGSEYKGGVTFGAIHKIQAGAGAVPIITHSIEGAINFAMKDKHAAFNIHDANYLGFDGYTEAMQEYNQHAYNVLSQYDVVSQMSKSLNFNLSALMSNPKAFNLFRENINNADLTKVKSAFSEADMDSLNRIQEQNLQNDSVDVDLLNRMTSDVDSDQQVTMHNISKSLLDLAGLHRSTQSTDYKKRLASDISDASVKDFLKEMMRSIDDKGVGYAQRKDANLASMEGLSQYANGDNAAYRPTFDQRSAIFKGKGEQRKKAKERTEQFIGQAGDKKKSNRVKHSKIGKGSSADTSALNDAVLNNWGMIDRHNIADTFNKMLMSSGNKDSAMHQEHMKGLVDDVFTKVVQPFTLFYGTKDGVNPIGRVAGSDMFILNETFGLSGKSSRMPGTNAMSAAEVFVHEVTHRVTEAGIDGNPALRRQLMELWRQAGQQIRIEDLMPKGLLKSDARYADEYKLAKANWDHIFTPKSSGKIGRYNVADFLHEFMAFGMSNENFRNQLKGIQFQKPSVKALPDGANIWQRMKHMFKTMLNDLSNKLKHSDDQTLSGEVDKLFMKMSGVNEYYNSMIKSMAVSSTPKVLRDNALLNKAGGYAKRGLEYTGNKIKDFNEYLVKSEYNFAQQMGKVLTDIRGRTKLNSRIYEIRRKATSEIRRGLQDTSETVANEIMSAYKIAPTVEQESALKAVLLHAQADVLDDYFGSKTANEAIRDKGVRSKLIEDFKEKLASEHLPLIAKALAIQAENLGVFMATGNNHLVHGFMSVKAIVDKIADPKLPPTSKQTLEMMIGALATLHALDNTNQKHLDDYTTLNLSEQGGVDYSKALLRDYRQMQADEFKDTPYNLTHGYVQHQLDNYKSHVIIDKNDAEGIKYYTDRGYTKSADIADGRQLYINGVGEKSDYIHGSMVMNRKGRITGYENVPTDPAKRKVFEAEKRNKAISQYNQALDKNTIYPIPQLDGTNADIKSYRYDTNLTQKQRLLGSDDVFTNTFSAMYAQLPFNKLKRDTNTEMIHELKNLYDQHFENNPDMFIKINENSPDPRIREIWESIPAHAKQQIKRAFASTPEGFQVRKDMLDLIFGYHSADIRSQLFRDAENRNALTNLMVGMSKVILNDTSKMSAIVRANDAYKEIIRYTKDAIVIKSLKILTGNTFANLHQLNMAGLSNKDAIKFYYEAYGQLKAYKEDSKKLFNIEQKLKMDISSAERAKLSKDKVITEDALATNLVSSMYDNGIIPIHIDDVQAIRNYRYLDKGRSKLSESRIAQKTPEAIRKTIKELLMTHDSSMYKGLSYLSQFSDFGARYARYKDLINKGYTQTDAAHRTNDEFVDYTLPQSKLLNALDGYGALWFSKYKIRIQKTIMNHWVEAPGKMASSLLFLELLGGTGDTIMDSNMITNGLQNNFRDPFSMFQKVGETTNFYRGYSAAKEASKLL